ncbi:MULTISPECIES: helix-turn-helix domain-containing protein [unclassified Streptomyces]|uniref:helix-turn-helix domain-containing protein n=1 Tax=unclassified Streptomyces TaxID=2593676 RepID=UPI002E79A062|nr:MULTISPECIES: helix-turn-helix domain-containing protein [unclassified Streptomyces]MEE1762769.1 helix-turn-helix domain-containing protein [Streptomyces sp. SP18BB07]MEE1830840.1 helix-turn-helix domain-containing protein [Streptomyces sp. SP17KL33]
MTFGQLLRTHRTRRGLSLTQLAARMHFNPGHISKIETGKRSPSVSFAKACDRALDLGSTFTTIAAALEAVTREQQGWVRPAQLPTAKRHFVGRQDDLRRLDELLHGHDQPLAVPVAVINGPPGVGKTALAVQWAHRVVNDGHFPDGQLFVSLEGPEPDTAAAPFDVLGDLLRAVGVPPERIPVELDQRATTLRSYLHGREMLLILDNAADAQQISPLLPGSPGCVVVVTSRSRLPGLTPLVDAVSLPLPELRRPEAAMLIGAVIGQVRAAVNPGAVDALAELCGCLPLALVLAAERIVSHQHHSAETLAAELVSRQARLNLAEGDVVLRDAFETSYRALDEQSARVFRGLGLLPGQLIDVDSTASIAGVPPEEASLSLCNLAAAHLVQRHDERHYRMHDLLRAYAADLARRPSPRVATTLVA